MREREEQKRQGTIKMGKTTTGNDDQYQHGVISNKDNKRQQRHPMEGSGSHVDRQGGNPKKENRNNDN